MVVSNVGLKEGGVVGIITGDGFEVGIAVGSVGLLVGDADGIPVGAPVGEVVGVDGSLDGKKEGLLVGVCVGRGGPASSVRV